MEGKNLRGLTFEKWLASGGDLPEGFLKWKDTYSHWNQGDPISWAIHCFNQLPKRSKTTLSK